MNTLRFFLVVLLAGASFTLLPASASAQPVGVSLSIFQNDLGRYGRWVNSPRYGQVWIYSEPGFRPYYSNGHWGYSEYGWAWISDFDWGWAPFHYGRWEEDPYYGWIWIPGYEWAPAWVSWSEYDGNYGWAPLGFGLGINVSFGAIPYNRWTFVPRQHICSPQINNYYINPGRNRRFNNAVVINNIYVNNNVRFYAGPRRGDVERYTRSRVTVRNIEYGRPQRYVSSDRGGGIGDNGYDRPGSIQRPRRNDDVNGGGRNGSYDRADRNYGSRPSNSLPRSDRDNIPERRVTPEVSTGGGFQGRTDNNSNRVSGYPGQVRMAERRQGNNSELQVPSPSAPVPRRTERPNGSPQRIERTQQVQAERSETQYRQQGNRGSIQPTPAARPQYQGRPQRQGGGAQYERIENNGRGGRGA
ncbi:MAG: hypothetical protein H7Y03_00105 [Chitinophagaceae bacterium]|nr:hypothetical protein [Chitinophagaceae bacterium]